MSSTSRVTQIMKAANWLCVHNIKKGQNVVIVTDPAVHQEIPVAFAAAASSVGAEVVTVYFEPPVVASAWLPKSVGDIMKGADIIMEIASQSLSWAIATCDAQRAGAKSISIPGGDIDTFVKGNVEVYFDEDEFQKMLSRTVWLEDAMAKADEIRFTSEKGTDIKASIKGRCPLPSAGVPQIPVPSAQALMKELKPEGTYSCTAFPSGETMVAPVEETTDGVVVLDVSMGGVGRLTTPLKINVKKGRVYEMTGGLEAERIRTLIEKSGEGADNFAEFGVGTNHMGTVTGKVNDDKKLAGTAHIALGSNIGFGGGVYGAIDGKVQAKVHLDGTFTDATVYLDGKKVVENGKFLF